MFIFYQLRDSTNEEMQSQLEKVQAAHMESQQQLQAAQLALSQAHAENSQLAAQYQQYTKQLAEQTQSLQGQVSLNIVSIRDSNGLNRWWQIRESCLVISLIAVFRSLIAKDSVVLCKLFFFT